jgi:mRNA interferase HigB
MKVHLIKAKTARKFAQDHASASGSFKAWIEKLKAADWDSPEDMRQTFASVDILGKGRSRAVFNVGGNNYRIICKYQFGDTMVHLFICWIGTHAEYTELCKAGKQYTIEEY